MAVILCSSHTDDMASRGEIAEDDRGHDVQILLRDFEGQRVSSLWKCKGHTSSWIAADLD